MKRFDFRGWSWLGILNTFLAIFFNKLLVRRVFYRDSAADIVDRIDYELMKRLDYPGEL